MTAISLQKLLLGILVLFIAGCSTDSARISAKSECNSYKRFSAAYDDCLNNIDRFYDENDPKD